ncbi:RNA-directed DNA polymerase [Photobacterium damselae]|nr:RNA-directed DNA polymerase [Photobacterium damselae]
MKIFQSPWFEFLRKTGIEENQAKVLTFYALQLQNKSLPVVFELAHFSKLLGVELALISRIATSPHKFYRSFQVKKRRGGNRDISAPYPKLYYIQSWIKTNILENLSIHEASYAYEKGKSHIDNAKNHIGDRDVLKLDLVDFFGNINIDLIVKVFINAGYSKKLSCQLANICSNGVCLPQGSPSSPIISNIVLFELDKELSILAQEHKLTYTRYADDLTFSGEKIDHKIFSDVIKKIEGYGFEVNKDKSNIYKKGKRKTITGIVVSRDGIRSPKKIRRQFRMDSYNLIKNKHQQFNGELGQINPIFLDEVIGRGKYIQTIEPNNVLVRERLISLLALRKELLMDG